MTTVFLVFPALPARAGDWDERAAVEDLISRMAADLEPELAGHRPEVPLPVDARAARLEARLESLSRRIFAVRYEARRALAGLIPGFGLGDGPDRAGILPGAAMGLDDAADLADLGAVLSAWARLETVLDELAARRDDLAAAAGVEPPVRRCPVTGGHGFGNDWGDDRGWGRAHAGIDLHAEFGSSLVAVEDGVVLQAGWHWAGGVQAYLLGDSSGDVYYYAHMTWWAPEVDAGARVSAGDVIGWVGMSGNADTPHLHFGWMPDAGQVDLDRLENPYWLLREICG
jgi:murein DD-endopeptidase MepM/ murein hydrolase activator NlpD